jgi:thioesterase domain-containing protein
MLNATGAERAALQALMHEAIPLARCMGVEVVATDANGLVLRAPLAINANDHDTAFGGSLSALATLAGWGLLYLLLDSAGERPNIVIQRGVIDYRRPISADLDARAPLPDETAWRRFNETLRRKGRARIVLRVTMGDAAVFDGTYVVDQRG